MYLVDNETASKARKTADRANSGLIITASPEHVASSRIYSLRLNGQEHRIVSTEWDKKLFEQRKYLDFLHLRHTPETLYGEGIEKVDKDYEIICLGYFAGTALAIVHVGSNLIDEENLQVVDVRTCEHECRINWDNQESLKMALGHSCPKHTALFIKCRQDWAKYTIAESIDWEQSSNDAMKDYYKRYNFVCTCNLINSV